MQTAKKCTVCKEIKVFPDDFYGDKRIKSGHRARCKDCDKKITKKYSRTPRPSRQHTEEQRKRINERNRARLSALRSNSEKYRRYKSEKDRQYRQTENGKVSHKNQKYRRRALFPEGRISIEQWALILERFGGRCAYCGCSKDLTVDHFIPISKGGAVGAGNIVPACFRCNSSKQDRAPEAWCPSQIYNKIANLIPSALS